MRLFGVLSILVGLAVQGVVSEATSISRVGRRMRSGAYQTHEATTRAGLGSLASARARARLRAIELLGPEAGGPEAKEAEASKASQ